MKPREVEIAVSAPARVDAVLGPSGTLSGALPGYEHRRDQLAMAREVDRALRERRYLVAEAGTGTGKTLAYLVPAALSGRKVIVSTATKTLQEQIWTKDLPLLAAQGGLTVEAAYLKGRANYYCLARGARFAGNPTFPTRAEAALWPRIEAWARTTATGDRSEIDLPDQYGAWRELSASGETCLGKDCDRYEECFVTLARARAAEADLVLVNHHLFFADLAMRTGRAGVEVLPAYDAVVFDEAHALEDIATEYFGLMVSSWRIDELARDVLRALADRPDLQKLVKQRADELSKAGDRYFTALAVEMRGGSRRGNGADLRVALTAEMLEPVADDQGRLDAALEEVREVFVDAEGALSAALARRAAELRVELKAVTAMKEPSRVYFAEARGRGVFLRAAPVDVAEELVERLYRRVDSVIFTSATLAAGGRLDYFRRQVGLVPEFDVTEAVYPGPFDYRRQAALVVPEGLADPAHPGLFATQSFWEGVDVPGEALSLVVIDKLPFAPPGDPVTAARVRAAEAEGQDAFSTLSVPAAALSLKQGFGRLIRTSTDRGIVAVLDRRLVTRGYGRAFLATLPPAPLLRSVGQARSWWEDGARAAS